MNYTINIMPKSALRTADKEEGPMKSIYASKVIKQAIWRDFTVHFKSSTSKASYQTDIDEAMDYFHKDFLAINGEDAGVYFRWLKERVSRGEILPGTMAKKFRELHSFAAYICENRERYQVDEGYQDGYYPYIKMVAKQEKFVKHIPPSHIDRLLEAAREDLMAYCIIVLMYRAGLASTEIAGLKPEDIGIYGDGIYASVAGRRGLCYIPEDAFQILEKYLAERKDNSYLFYNRRGNPLNTMYISRMMKKYAQEAGIPSYSAQSIRNSCGCTLFAYEASPEQVARQMGTTGIQIKRYQNISYKEALQREAGRLVKLKIEPP